MSDISAMSEAELDTHLAQIQREEDELRARLEAPDALAQAARWFAANGHPVFPLHNPERAGEAWVCSCGQPCSSPAKHPRTRRGLTDATTDPAQIDAWWGKWPAANIGLVTGHAYDVIDVDGLPGVESFAQLRHATCPPGCCDVATCEGDGVTVPATYGVAVTPRGRHLYLAATGNGNTTSVLPGVDYRGVGGYVVAPPSLGISGQRYFYVEPLTDPREGGDAA